MGSTTQAITPTSSYWGWTGSVSNSYIWLFDAYTATLNITGQNAQIAQAYYMGFADTLQIQKADWKEPITYQFDVRLNEGYTSLNIDGLENYTLTEDTANNYIRVSGSTTGTKQVTAKGLLPLSQEMNENIFDAVGDTITGLSDALTKPWEGILNIFYDTTEEEVTEMGVLVLIGLGATITLFAFWTILKLFKQRN